MAWTGVAEWGASCTVRGYSMGCHAGRALMFVSLSPVGAAVACAGCRASMQALASQHAVGGMSSVVVQAFLALLVPDHSTIPYNIVGSDGWQCPAAHRRRGEAR